jgi:hypothetical protein
MFKKCLLILTAAGAITIAAAFAAPLESQSNDQAGGRSNDRTSQTTNPAHEHGCRHHNGSSDPVRRSAELTAQLNLTPDQQTKVLSALQSESSQMQSVLQDTSISREDCRSKMREIRTATDSQIRGVPDSNQQKQWDEMQTGRGQRTQRRGSATPDSNSGQEQPAQ